MRIIGPTLLLFCITISFSLIVISGQSGIHNIQNTSTLASSTTWNFVALGDSRQHSGNWDAVNQKRTQENTSNPIRAALMNSVVENNDNLSFILHTGDMVYYGGEQDDWDRYYEDIENVTSNNITIYNAIGNHERYTYNIDSNTYGPIDEDFSVYQANVDLPGNERYYSFDYRNQVHIVIINTEENWDGSFDIITEQESWLVNDLEINEIDFVIAVFHRPAYSIRDSNRVHDAQQVRIVLEPLLLQYDVDLVFSGHDHYYYRTTREGIVHITAGGAGADLYTNRDVSEWQENDVYFSEYHYCNVTVKNESDGRTTVKVDTLIFNVLDQTTTLGDSVLIDSLLNTTTTTTTTESTYISATTDEIHTTSSTTTASTTPIFLISVLSGLVFALILRKQKF
jgi:hypothetical protein